MDPLSGTSSAGSIREYVTPDEKARYDKLLEQIQKILGKGPPFSQGDSKQLERLLTELKGMHDRGLTRDMDNFLDVLFAFAEAAGANPSQNNFYIPPDKLEALSKANMTIGGKTMGLVQALQVVLDPKYDPESTKKLGDMLLDFSRWGYDMYTTELKKLKKQIDIATAAINNLKALQDILNMIKTKYPDNYKFPPTSWDEIPSTPIPPDTQSIQDKVRNAMKNAGAPWNSIWGQYGNKPNDGTMGVVTSWIKNNPDTYATWSDDFFKKEIGIDADPKPDAATAAARLLSARDQLKKQLEEMEKEGGKDLDKGEGSPYATIKKVIDDIDAKFPPGQFPYTTPPTDWYKQSMSVASLYLRQYIIDGNKTNNTISDAIDKAVQANQNLSSKMSDEIKAKNLTLQTFFDILTQVADALSKNLTGTAQKISR